MAPRDIMFDVPTEYALTAGPVPLRPPVRGRAPFGLAVALAILAHAGALYAAFALQPHRLGADGTKGDAIEVTLVHGAAQESTETVLLPSAGANSAAVAVSEGEAPANMAVVASPAAEQVAPPSVVLPRADISPGEIATASLPPLKLATEPPVIDAPPPATTTTSPVQNEGGAVSRSVVEAPPRAAAAGAPPGIVDAYKMAVQRAIRRSQPPFGRGRGGEAAIVFTIAPSGGVEGVRIQVSSGDAAQDEMAISAVRATRFPPPDPRMTAEQRTWPVRYQFAGRR